MNYDLITLKAAAEKLSCSIKTIRRLIDEGKLEACEVRGRGSLRVIVKSLNAHIKRQIIDFQTKSGIPPEN